MEKYISKKLVVFKIHPRKNYGVLDDISGKIYMNSSRKRARK